MSIVIGFIVIGVLILVHEFGHFITAKLMGVDVERFSLGFGPKLFAFKRKDTEYLISLIPLGGYVKLAGDSWEDYKGRPHDYLSQKTGKRAAIIFSGSIFNYLLSILCFCIIFFVGYPTLTSQVGEVMQGYPAFEAGILKGDAIIAVDGKEVRYWEELQEIIGKKTEGDKVDVVVKRDEELFDFSLVPRIETAKNLLGQQETRALIGIMPAEEFVKVRYGLFDSIKLGLQKTFYITGIFYKAIFRMVTGVLSFRETVTGPLGIFYVARKAVDLGFSFVLNMIAVLGVSLAVINLLPIPVLDGGHALFLLIEKIRGRPLDKKVDELIARVGLTFIIFLAIFVTCNDIIKFGWLDKLKDFFISGSN
jgi:regulator of sigma E protease